MKKLNLILISFQSKHIENFLHYLCMTFYRKPNSETWYTHEKRIEIKFKSPKASISGLKDSKSNPKMSRRYGKVSNLYFRVSS